MKLSEIKKGFNVSVGFEESPGRVRRVLSFAATAIGSSFSALSFVSSLSWRRTVAWLKTPVAPSISKLVKEVDQLCEKGAIPFTKIRPIIDRFAEQILKTDGFQKRLSGQDLKSSVHYLCHRVEKICLLDDVPPVEKEQMIDRICKNYLSCIEEADRRVKRDLREGELECFGVGSRNSITSIHPLGDETHNRGRTPLLFKFDNGCRVVYKPRSVEPERLLCDTTDSVLQVVGFGTYKVLSKLDEFNNAPYGYCEFLENKEEENKVSHLQELHEYFQKLAVLDEIALRLGISDLHYLNIATRKLEPTVIDAEVFRVPKSLPSGIFDAPYAAAYDYDEGAGLFPKLIGINRIWFDDSIGVEPWKVKCCLDEEAQEKLQVKDRSVFSRELSEDASSKIEKAYEKLGKEKARIVPVTTVELEGAVTCFLRCVEKREAVDAFVQTLKSKLQEDGIEFVEEATPEIRELFLADASNFDVPIFYYDPAKQEVLYQHVVIGRKASL